MKWAYGVTTVPSRFEDLLPKTLESLALGGFAEPRLFVDGRCTLPNHLLKYPVTKRVPAVRTFGNWVLAAWELYLRDPTAERYAIFQDDLVTYKNLREYLEQCQYPKRGYMNLYTFPENVKAIHKGWYAANQRGLGAVGLVFSNEALRVLLRQEHMVDRPLDAARGWRSIDGGIVAAMRKAGWREFVHNPSLVQHIGDFSTMGNNHQPKAPNFLGEAYDALELIEPPVIERKTVRPKFALPKVRENVAPTSSKTSPEFSRLGLVGYHCATGLGELNRQIHAYGELDAWLIKPHPGHKTFDYPQDIDIVSCPMGNPAKIEKFLQLVDTLIFCERPYYPNLVEIARKRRKRLVCVPMMEWMPAGARGWPQEVDLFLCPTRQCYDQFQHVVPCVYFPWPVDTQRFKFKPRTRCERFLFLGGNGGWKGRKGTEIILQAKALWPEMPLVVRSQQSVHWPPGVKAIGEVEDNADLYLEGDVLIAPHSVDGLGLEPMEAMACGLPVITTDGEPWNEIPSIGKIEATVERKVVQRPVDWYKPSAKSIVAICKELLGKNIEWESQQVRAWAEARSWEKRAGKFINLVKLGEKGAVTV